MARCTKKELYRALKDLNASFGFPENGWEQDEIGNFNSVIRSFGLYGDAGGWMLVQYMSTGGGFRHISKQGTIGECYDMIRMYHRGILAGMEERDAAN
jgi:hypothetical protein